jgi:hypothetical protein
VPEAGNTTPGVPGWGTGEVSLPISQVSENIMREASETERSMDLGMNMLTRVRRFSKYVVVFSMAAAVERRLREQMRFGIR